VANQEEIMMGLIIEKLVGSRCFICLRL